MTRVVLDTNVMVSGLLAPRGNEALVLLAVSQGWIVPSYSEEILAEYTGVLTRRKFSFSSEEVESVLGMLRERGEFVRPERGPFSSPDTEDTKLLDCAFTSSASFLVTGNKRHFPDASYGATLVIGARELLLHLATGL